MLTTYIVFFISLWIHGCRSECTKENPFYMIDKQCTNFNDVCMKKDYGPCKSLLQACAQCPASNLTESALVNILTILRDQQNKTTEANYKKFKARLNNSEREILEKLALVKNISNQQNKTTEANYSNFETRLNISEREILEKLSYLKNISIAICVLVVLVLLYACDMKCQINSFPGRAVSRRNAGASRDYEAVPMRTIPRSDETIHQTLENIEDQIKTMTKTLSGATTPSKQKNGDLSINKSSKYYILELNFPKSIDFNIESGRVIEMHTGQITIKSIFYHIKEVLLSYSNVESIGNIKKKIADLLECPAENIILFCGNKNLDDNILVFMIDIEQLKFCHLIPLVESNIKEYFSDGDSSKIYKYRDNPSSEELLLKKYSWGCMKILKENEAILNELETFQITIIQEGFVHLNGVFTDKDYFYILMEKMEGSIKDYIKNNHPLSEEIIVKWAKQILSALKYLHDHGIIHRNIKPSSIFLDKDGNIKLSSFGLAKHARWGDKQYLKKELQQSLAGTFRYMAPDICNNMNYGVQGDVWSFGATMIEMATGKEPFHGKDESKALMEIGVKKRIPFELDKTRSSKLKDFIDKCLIADPNIRATVDDLLNHDFLIPK